MLCESMVSLLMLLIFILFFYKGFPCARQLGYMSHYNTAAPKTIIWVSYAGELVSHPQRGVLQLFIHKNCLKGFDKQAYLLSQTFRYRLQQIFFFNLHWHSKIKSHCSQPCALVHLCFLSLMFFVFVFFIFYLPFQLTMLLWFSVWTCFRACVRA